MHPPPFTFPLIAQLIIGLAVHLNPSPMILREAQVFSYGYLSPTRHCSTVKGTLHPTPPEKKRNRETIRMSHSSLSFSLSLHPLPSMREGWPHHIEHMVNGSLVLFVLHGIKRKRLVWEVHVWLKDLFIEAGTLLWWYFLTVQRSRFRCFLLLLTRHVLWLLMWGGVQGRQGSLVVRALD